MLPIRFCPLVLPPVPFQRSTPVGERDCLQPGESVAAAGAAAAFRQLEVDQVATTIGEDGRAPGHLTWRLFGAMAWRIEPLPGYPPGPTGEPGAQRRAYLIEKRGGGIGVVRNSPPTAGFRCPRRGELAEPANTSHAGGLPCRKTHVRFDAVILGVYRSPESEPKCKFRSKCSNSKSYPSLHGRSSSAHLSLTC